MNRLCVGAFAALIVLSLTGADGADDPYVIYQANSLSYSQLALTDARRIQDLKADGAGRIWVATDVGILGVSGTTRANQFPLTNSSPDELIGIDVKGLAFGNLGGKENFFLGFQPTPPGIQYGQLIDTGIQPGANTPLTVPTSLTTLTGVNVINALSSDGANIWAATGTPSGNGGLVRWKLSGNTNPSAEAVLPDTSGAYVRLTATDPWPFLPPSTPAPATVYLVESSSHGASSNGLYLVPSTQIDNPTDSVVAMTFDADHNLWVATTSTSGVNSLYEYPSPYTTRNGPFTFATNNSPINSIAVDPYNPGGAVVWVGTGPATESGQQLGAHFKKISALGTPGGWTAYRNVGSTEAARVYVDPAGNIWLGVNGIFGGVRSLLCQLVTLDRTRYLGYDTRAQVTVTDVRQPNDVASVDVTVNGATIPCRAVKDATGQNTGQFTGSFGFAAEAGPGVIVVSGSKDTAIKVDYKSAIGQTLTATASWANIVPFQDSLWVGSGCFLRSLGF